MEKIGKEHGKVIYCDVPGLLPVSVLTTVILIVSVIPSISYS